jgi:excisionase family DNA binding protein
MLTPSEAAASLEVSKPTFRKIIESGALPYIVLPTGSRYRRCIRVSEVALAEFKQTHPKT